MQKLQNSLSCILMLLFTAQAFSEERAGFEGIDGAYEELTPVIEPGDDSPRQPPRPLAPLSISMPYFENDAYHIDWTNVAGASYYVVEEKEGDAPWAPLALVDTPNRFTFSTHKNTGISYRYRVKACREQYGPHLCSEYQMTLEDFEFSYVAAPNTLEKLSLGNGDYFVTWNTVRESDYYVLEHQNGPNADWIEVQDGIVIEENAIGLSGLAVGQYHGFRIKACVSTSNVELCSPYTYNTNGQANFIAPPASITTPRRQGNNYIISWDSVIGADYYVIEESHPGRGNPEQWTELPNSPLTNTTTVVFENGAVNSLDKHFRVKACVSDIEGDICSDYIVSNSMRGGTIACKLPPFCIDSVSLGDNDTNGSSFSYNHYLTDFGSVAYYKMDLSYDNSEWYKVAQVQGLFCTRNPSLCDSNTESILFFDALNLNYETVPLNPNLLHIFRLSDLPRAPRQLKILSCNTEHLCEVDRIINL